MAFEAEQFTFGAPPKCALNWVLAALPNAGVVLPRDASAHIHQPGKVRGKPSVTITRDPADWLRSFYQERIGPTGVEEIDELLLLKRSHQDYLMNRQPLDFVAFVEKYLTEMPGRATKVFALYKSDHEVPITDLPGGLIKALDTIGVEYDRHGIMGTGPVNVTEARLQWPDDLLKRVQAVEKPKRRRKRA